MRALRPLILTLLILAAAGAMADVPGLTSKKLPNGLEVIVLENHAVPLVTIEIAVRSGGFVESPEYSGLSHLYEHMFFKANRALPNQEAYLKRLRELGAIWNGTTNTELVNYFLTLPTDNTREGAIFLRDALLYPLFQQKELERERVVVLGEFDRNEANPTFHLLREMNRKLWGDQFSRKNVIGDREVIVTTPRAKMTTLKERYYVPNNAALLFAGDIRPEEAYAVAEELFGTDWKPAGDPHTLYPEPPIPPLKQSSKIAVIRPVKTVLIQIAWHGPSMTTDTPSTFAADTLSFILQQPSSRFHRNLIDSGLFDNVNLSYFSQAHTGPITATGVTSPERADRAHAALVNEIGHLTDPGYFSDEELAFAKDQTEVAEIYNRERPSQFVLTLAFWWSAGGGLDYYRNYIDKLRRVSRTDIQTYVRRYIADKPSVTGVLLAEEARSKVALVKDAEVIRPISGSSGTAMASTASHDIKTEDFDVDGVHVVLRKNPNSEVVAARAFLKGGVAFAGPDRAGLEPMLLDIASKQSVTYPKERMARELTRLGAQLGAESGPDSSALTLTTLKRSFSESFAIFLDALVHPVINDSELALAREHRLTQLSLIEQNPDSYIGSIARQNAYGSHPYAIDAAGVPAVVKAATAKQLRELHAATVNRSRLLLVVVGNVTREEVEKQLRLAIKDLTAGNYKAIELPPMPNAGRATTKLVPRDLPTVYVLGLFPAPGMGADDEAATRIGLSVLSHRLFEEIRTKRNLSYAAYSFLRSSVSGAGQVYVTTPDPNAAVRVMRDEVERIRTTPIPETELRDSIREYRTGVLMEQQGSDDIAANIGQWQVATGSWSNFDALLAKFDTLTPEQVRAAMDRYVHHVSFALLGKVDGVDTKLLESF